MSMASKGAHGLSCAAQPSLGSLCSLSAAHGDQIGKVVRGGLKFPPAGRVGGFRGEIQGWERTKEELCSLAHAAGLGGPGHEDGH